MQKGRHNYQRSSGQNECNNFQWSNLKKQSFLVDDLVLTGLAQQIGMDAQLLIQHASKRDKLGFSRFQSKKLLNKISVDSNLTSGQRTSKAYMSFCTNIAKANMQYLYSLNNGYNHMNQVCPPLFWFLQQKYFSQLFKFITVISILLSLNRVELDEDMDNHNGAFPDQLEQQIQKFKMLYSIQKESYKKFSQIKLPRFVNQYVMFCTYVQIISLIIYIIPKWWIVERSEVTRYS